MFVGLWSPRPKVSSYKELLPSEGMDCLCDRWCLFSFYFERMGSETFGLIRDGGSTNTPALVALKHTVKITVLVSSHRYPQRLYAYPWVRRWQRKRFQGLMIPNKKRAQQLDDRLRVLGFHARASGIYKTAACKSAASSAITAQLFEGELSGKDGGAGTAGRRCGSAGSTSRPLTQEEKQESMAKRAEACKKRRPGSSGGEGVIGRR